MTGAEVRKMTNEEIALEIKRLSEQLFTLRSQSVTEKVEDLSQFGKVRKDIARLKTEQSARRIKDSGGARQPAEAGKKPARKPAAAGAKKAGAAKKTTTKKAKAAS